MGKPESRWSEHLIKRKIDENIFDIDDDLNPEEADRIDDLRLYCDADLSNLKNIKEVRNEVRKTKKAKPRSDIVGFVADAILEDLDEIESDLKFAEGRRGKFVLFVNDWGQKLYKDLRQSEDFNDIVVGTHVDSELILVHGEVKDASHLSQIIKLISASPPGVPVQYRVIVESS